MKLQIDNFDGAGLRDYSSAIDSQGLPHVLRRLNKPAEMRLGLVSDGPDFVVPANGARIMLAKDGGQNIFTGYLTGPPTYEYLGWGETGPIYRYHLVAQSDEIALDRKRLPDLPPFVGRSAGAALRQLSDDLLPGGFDTAGVQDLDPLPYYSPSPQQKWSQHAAEIALRARASYRAMAGDLVLEPVGGTSHTLSEADASFSPDGLKLDPKDGVVNDLTVIGQLEPQDHVTDYFVGDGVSLRFYLSQIPFARRNRTILEEEYQGGALDPTRWAVSDPSTAISVNGGQLVVSGGTGVDGQTFARLLERIELGGAFIIQHGDVTFSAASDGVLGGLYAVGISAGGCLAGFRVTPIGTQSHIQAVVNGVLTGPVLTTTTGHRYALTTRFYASEIYRQQQICHSSVRPAGNGRGGAPVNANVRFVLEVHDVNPADPGSFVTASTVLYDGLINSAPGACTYALVNATNLHCAISFSRLTQALDAEVRSARPFETFRTRLAGSLIDGAECLITGDPAVQFFPQSVPIANELIEVRYRGRGRSMARLTNQASVSGLAQGNDDGVRAAVRQVQAPSARTSADCETAALALLDDATGIAWSGEYSTWSDFLPNAEDIFPGDSVALAASSQGASFSAIVREVEIQVKDLEGEHCAYRFRFADDAAEPLGFEFDTAHITNALDVTGLDIGAVGTAFLPDLTTAAITQVASTTVTLDAGVVPPVGGGIEVRRTDSGWGPGNDRNLIGRFSTESFTVPRLARLQDYYLRQFDAAVTPKYSRYSAALHLDRPL